MATNSIRSSQPDIHSAARAFDGGRSIIPENQFLALQ
jgi:hypothetical protein